MRDLPFDRVGSALRPRFLGPGDLPWIAALVDDTVAAMGRPWAELAARLARPRVSPSSRAAHALVVALLRRELTGRVATAVRPRQARAALFGAAAATADRATAFAQAAATLGCTPGELAAALFADLPEARQVAGQAALPSPSVLLARANHELVARAVGRAREVRVRLRGHALAIVRAARGRGLLCEVREAGEATCTLRLTGPLALFRRTGVYGAALASLLGVLAWADHLELIAVVVDGDQDRVFHLVDRHHLIPSPRPPTTDSAVEAALAADLRRLGAAWHVVREPMPLALAAGLAFPDFALVHRSEPARAWLVEVVGFWTAPYLAAKLAAYAALGRRDVLLLVDERRACGPELAALPGPVLRYRRRVEARAVLALVEG